MHEIIPNIKKYNAILYFTVKMKFLLIFMSLAKLENQRSIIMNMNSIRIIFSKLGTSSVTSLK